MPSKLSMPSLRVRQARYSQAQIAKLEQAIATADARGMSPRTIALYHRKLKMHQQLLANYLTGEASRHTCPTCGHIC